MRNIVILCTLLSATLLATGCSAVGKAVFGIEELKVYRTDRVESFYDYSRALMPCTQLVATAVQQDGFIRIDLDSNMMQHRAQPVQILFFDGDSLIFYHISCYTQKGLFGADWNTHGSFNSFPPRPTVVSDPMGSMTLGSYADRIAGMESQSRYTVVVIWCNVLRRMSEKAVEAIAENIGGREDVTVFLVNTDQWWANYFNRQE